MKLHTIESMEEKAKRNEVELDDKQQAKVNKKKEVLSLIKAVEYSIKKSAGRWIDALQCYEKFWIVIHNFTIL